MASAQGGKRPGEEPGEDNSDGSGGMLRASAAQMANRKIAAKKGLRKNIGSARPQSPAQLQQPLPQFGASSVASGAASFPPPNPPANPSMNVLNHPPNQQGYAFGVQPSSNGTGKAAVNSGFAFTIAQPQSSNSPFTIPQNSSFNFSGVQTLNFDQARETSNHYKSTEDTEQSQTKRRYSKGSGNYSPEETQQRNNYLAVIKARFLKKDHTGTGLQDFEYGRYDAKSTEELRSNAAGDDVPLWDPRAPILPGSTKPQLPQSQFSVGQQQDEQGSQPVAQNYTFDVGYGVPATPAPAAQQQQPHSAQNVGAKSSFDLGNWRSIAFEETPHLPEDALADHVPAPCKPLPKYKSSHDPYIAAIRQLFPLSHPPRIYNRSSQLRQQMTHPPLPATAQDHEMALESPPQNGGNGNFGSIFAPAAPAHVNIFGQSMSASALAASQPKMFTAPSVTFSAPPSSFSSSPMAFSAPPIFSTPPVAFSAPPLSSPTPSLFFPTSPTPAPAPPTLFSAPPAVFSASPKAAPAVSVAAPAFSPPAPTPPAAVFAPSPAFPAPAVAAPASSVAAPVPPMVASAPPISPPAPFKAAPAPQVTPHASNMALTAAPVASSTLSRLVPRFSLEALAPRKVPSMFTEKQKYQFRMAFQLLSLDAGFQNHIEKDPANAFDPDCLEFYQEVQALILEEAGRLIPGTKRRMSDDEGQVNGHLEETKRQVLGDHSYTPTKPANPPAVSNHSYTLTKPANAPLTPSSSGPSKKRKADEQITKDTYDADESEKPDEVTKKSRNATEEGVSYPKLPSPSSSNTAMKASNTAQLFQNLASGPVPKFDESASDASPKSAFQVPNFGASSSSAKAKPAGSVPKFGDSTKEAGQKPTFQVPKFGTPINFLDAFSKKAATDEKKEKAKRKAEEFDSDEDNEEEWERKDAEKQAAKKQKTAELATDEFKFKMPTAPALGQTAAPLPFSVSAFTTKSPTKIVSVEDTADTQTTNRSLFDRIEKDTNGEAKRQLPPSEENKSDSANTFSTRNIFGASTSATVNIFGASTSAPSNIFGAISTEPSDQKTPEKKRLGGFGTPFANPEATKLSTGLSASPNSGDNTWNPETPIKFGAFQAAPTPATSSKQSSALDPSVNANPFTGLDQKPPPAINITAATPTLTTTSKQVSIFDSAVKQKPFTGFGSTIFSSTPTTSSTIPAPSANFGVGFNFGAPPASTSNPTISNLVPSNNASAATSRGTTPDAGNTSDEEALQDEQIDLASASKGEESEETLFDGRARIQEWVEMDGGTRKWEVRSVGPLRLLKHKESGKSRLVGRVDASGKVSLNAGLMPSVKYEKASEKQIKYGAFNMQGRFSTWLVTFKDATMAEAFAKVCEENKNQ